MRHLFNVIKMGVLCLVATIGLASCSSSGSSGNTVAPPSTTVSGVAAAGAPLFGKAWLKDATGVVKGPVNIIDGGSFSFDVAGLTAPFLIQADGAAGGQGFLLHSVATGAGIANVNPITNMIVAASTGGHDPAAVFGSQTDGTAPGAGLANINQASVDAAIAAIKQMLAPLLTQFNASAIDPLKDAYVANPTTNKLDAVFDAVKITVAPPAGESTTPTFTIENRQSGATIASGDATTTSITSKTATPGAIPSVAVTTEIQAIGTLLTNWVTALNKGANLAAADLEPFYVGSAASPTAFGYNNGKNRQNTIDGFVSMFAQEFPATFGPIVSATNLALRGDVTAAYPGMYKVYEVYGTMSFQSGNAGAPDGGMYVAKESSTSDWKFIGNGRRIDADIHPYAHKYLLSNTSTSFETGLYIYLDDFANLGYKSARVTGPGLPTPGVTLSTQASNNMSATRLAIDPSQITPIQAADLYGKYPLTDNTITSIASQLAAGQKVKYLVELYSTATAGATGAGSHSLQIEITAPPVTHANLSATDSGYFPSVTLPALTSPTISSLAALLGTNIAFTTTLPTAFTASWADIHAYLSNWNAQAGPVGDAGWDKIVPLNRLSGTFLVPAPTTFTPTYVYLSCEVNDLANREFQLYAEIK